MDSDPLPKNYYTATNVLCSEIGQLPCDIKIQKADHETSLLGFISTVELLFE